MALLGKLLATLFTVLFSFFGRYMVAAKAVRLASVVSILAAVTALVATMYGVIDSLSGVIAGMAASAPNLAVGLGMAWNPVTLAAAGGYMTVWIAANVYVVRKRMLSVILGS